MSDTTLFHGGYLGEQTAESEVVFDWATRDPDNGWLVYKYETRQVGGDEISRRVQSDTVTVFFTRWSKEAVTAHIKQNRAALRRLAKWNEGRVT